MKRSRTVEFAVSVIILFFGRLEIALADVAYTFTTIDVPGALQTRAYGINSSGQIVGYYRSGMLPVDNSFLDSGGNFSTINAPGYLGLSAYGINDQGQIVETGGDIFGIFRSFGAALRRKTI